MFNVKKQTNNLLKVYFKIFTIITPLKMFNLLNIFNLTPNVSHNNLPVERLIKNFTKQLIKGFYKVSNYQWKKIKKSSFNKNLNRKNKKSFQLMIYFFPKTSYKNWKQLNKRFKLNKQGNFSKLEMNNLKTPIVVMRKVRDTK